MKRMKRKDISNGIRRAAVIIVAALVLISCGIDSEKEKKEQTAPIKTDRPVVAIETNKKYTGKVTVYAENDIVFDYLGEMEITGIPGKSVEIIIHTEVEHESE